MTSVVSNAGTGLQKRVPKDRRPQTNKGNAAVNSSVGNDANQTNHADKVKADSKLQPTVEQLRIANLMNDKIDDNELKAKIEQIVELTGSSRDDAVVALHDCDNDMAKAVDMILEGDGGDSQWKSTGKKKKPPKSATLAGDESKTDQNANKDSNDKQSGNKSDKANNRGSRGGGPPRLQKAALSKGQRKPRDSNRNSGDKNEAEDQNDIFSSSAQQPNFKSSDPSSGPRRGERGERGERRGRGRGGSGRGGNRGGGVGSFGAGPAGRGSRTFQNRGLQSNDGFPNSIDTWTNSTADQTSNKPVISTDCNTMTVGNWSDIAANEDWSEEDWEPSHMETKVFTPSTKISEKDESKVRDKLSANIPGSQSSNLSQFMTKPSVESSQPTMSSLLSANISRNTNVAGQTLLQQIQQSNSGATQSLNQYSLSYNKEATESIKSLVGLTSAATYSSTNNDLLSTNEQDLDSLTSTQTSNTNKASRLKPRSSKIPESAVEMPSNDSIAALGVHFGTLEFGSESNQFSLGADSSVFQDAVSHVTNSKKADANTSMLAQGNHQDNTYRSTGTAINDSANKVVSSSIIQNSVLGQSLTSDTLLDRSQKSSVSQYAQKVLDHNKSDYPTAAPKQTVSASDMSSNYKSNNYSDSYNASNYSTTASTGYPYSSNSQSVYGNQVVTNYSTNFSGTTIGNHSSASNQKLRDIDSQHKYDVSNTMVTNTPGSIGMISNSTVTTNVLKNTVPASKGVHNVPPGVAATPVLSTPYIVQNTGVPTLYPMGIPYDLQFQTTAHDRNYPYTQDVKYGRGTDTDVIPASSSQTSQTHNQTFVNTFPPGYGFYLAGPGMNMIPAQSIYPPAGPLAYPVAQPQSTGSAGSAFGKGSTSYGSHSYNTGYDSISGVAQTQDYVKQSYQQSVQQHNKGIAGSNTSDLTSNNSSIYGKSHSQISKPSYDKQSFQSGGPAFNLAAVGNQSNLNSYGSAQYMLPQSQHMNALHMSSLQTDVQNSGSGVGGRGSLSQSHKGSASGANSYGNPKYNWN